MPLYLNNSPPTPVTGVIVLATMSAPKLALASPAVYPPAVTTTLDATAIEGDTFQLQASATYNFAVVQNDVSTTLSAAIISAAQIISPFLASIASPARTFFRSRIRRGIYVSDWSDVLGHGDTAAPVITSAAAATFPEGAPVAFSLTADEPVRRWVIFSGENTRDVEIAGSTLRMLNNAAPNYAVQSLFSFVIMAEDYGGNQSFQLFTLNISDVIDMTPSQFNPSASGKSAFIDIISAGMAIRSQAANVGAFCGARTIERRIGKCYMEFTITAKPSNSVAVGMCPAAFSAPTAGAIPGSGANPGTSYLSSGTVYAAGAAAATYPVYTTGDVIMAAFDQPTGKIWYGKNGVWNGDPAAGTGGIAVTLAEWYAWAGAMVASADQRIVTANFGASAFAYAVPAGFGAYA